MHNGLAGITPSIIQSATSSSVGDYGDGSWEGEGQGSPSLPKSSLLSSMAGSSSSAGVTPTIETLGKGLVGS